MSADHIASYGLRGMNGKRIGTRYLYTFEDVREAIPLPWFRWRTPKSKAAYEKWNTARLRVALAKEPCP